MPPWQCVWHPSSTSLACHLRHHTQHCNCALACIADMPPLLQRRVAPSTCRLAGGLAWVGFLAVGTLGEQVKTRLEVANEEQNARAVSDQPVVELPDGVTYQELRIGGGSQPRKGDLVVLDFKCALEPRDLWCRQW